MEYTIKIDTTDIKSVEAGERKMALYENKGYTLVRLTATPFRATLTYKTAQHCIK